MLSWPPLVLCWVQGVPDAALVGSRTHETSVPKTTSMALYSCYVQFLIPSTIPRLEASHRILPNYHP